MHSLEIEPPAVERRADLHRFIVSLDRYWPRGQSAIAGLPVPQSGIMSDAALPPRVRPIALPKWADGIGVDGALLVPEAAVLHGSGEEWMRTDWVGAAMWYLDCVAERLFEERHGTIHSYSFRLSGWDDRIWERAWVNRIAMFLRRWAAVRAETDEETLFGPAPRAEIVMTHDVDAVAKGIRLRLKQGSFLAYNALNAALRLRFRSAVECAAAAGRFVLRSGGLWHFDEILEMEKVAGIRSIFNFYAGSPGLLPDPRTLLIDPAYSVENGRIRDVLARLRDAGWEIGLHQSFASWSDAAAMRRERLRLERAAATEVTSCRQHWFRFSWRETWPAQRRAGFRLDTTLGFTDRPGFRAAAALRVLPFGSADFVSLPTIIMDSHLYDYARLNDEERRAEISRWVGEVQAVGGVATVLWHQQVIGQDYGWGSGFSELLAAIAPLRG